MPLGASARKAPRSESGRNDHETGTMFNSSKCASASLTTRCHVQYAHPLDILVRSASRPSTKAPKIGRRPAAPCHEQLACRMGHAELLEGRSAEGVVWLLQGIRALLVRPCVVCMAHAPRVTSSSIGLRFATPAGIAAAQWPISSPQHVAARHPISSPQPMSSRQVGGSPQRMAVAQPAAPPQAIVRWYCCVAATVLNGGPG